ncbi:MAG: cellulase family glycosylhydrolase [Candidatus Omnitrophota bacterium]|nr:MAG: cellulase family glycosylhydrolase [Candidatus Omnitrophota bacterium]
MNIGKEVLIKGVNLGGWLLMEGYILGGPNTPEQVFKKRFAKVCGQRALGEFERIFRDNFIREEDFKIIAHIGANTVRVPFNFRLIEKAPFCYSNTGLLYLERALNWAEKYNLKVILDLHAAPGAQNCDWHGDSAGRALLWERRSYQDRTYVLWEKIVDRFKDKSALLGYDILNEPVLGKKSTTILKRFYKEAIKRIRAIDKNHLIFIEGDNWAQRIDFLKDLIADKISVSTHTYQPLSYAFNFTPFLKFPGRIDGVLWDEGRIYRYLEHYYKFSSKYKVRIFVGEFGINWRGGFWGELNWIKAILKAFKDFGFDYTYWTYKAVAQNCFPDGLYQYISDSEYINRPGPEYGWDNYFSLWGNKKQGLAQFLRTKNCTPNKKIISVLRNSFNH